jgi:GntR family transcriptional regulator, rspAB operon transcriptional repressor
VVGLITAALARLKAAGYPPFTVDAQEIAVAKKDHLTFLALDDDLHRTFAASIGHEGVWRTLQNVKLQMDRVRYLSLPEATPEELLTKQHRSIVRALHKGDPDQAEAAVRQHLGELLRSLPLLVQKFPDYFEGPTSKHLVAPTRYNQNTTR